jgi:hypothetical protein
MTITLFHAVMTEQHKDLCTPYNDGFRIILLLIGGPTILRGALYNLQITPSLARQCFFSYNLRLIGTLIYRKGK